MAHVAAEMGFPAHRLQVVARGRARCRWAGGPLEPPPHPRRPDHAEIEAQIEELRRTLKLGPVRIGYRLGVPASTVHRVLTRLGINGLDLDGPPTGQVIRRHERGRAGELVHVDIEKLGKIPDGRGWRA